MGITPAPFEFARAGAVVVALAMVCGGLLRAQSYFPQRPDDPRAVDFTKEAFGAQGDGAGDDAEALQQAVDRVRGAGVVLIPEGRYRLGKTVHVWQGIRLIGYGQKRPVLVLGRNTPGFQEGTGRYMIHFADNRPQGGGPIPDGSEFTFYSGMNNIDFELQEGNPAAIAVRFHVAQHSALTHMDFQVGSARAALEDIGNQASDIHVHGGEYGIITKRTAPVWQFLLMDSSFDGQRAAAIQTMEAGFTLVRVRFANMPAALQIAAGEVEQLYGRDLRMENIRQAAFVAGNWRNAHSAVTLTNIACSDVPRFFSGDQPVVAPSRHYVVERFSLGLEIGPDGREQGIHLRHHERALSRPAAVVASDILALPPMEKWVNVRTLGVKGETSADDTVALQAAIDEHPALFFPSGTYRVSAPLTLKPGTVLIGLNPGTTQITLAAGSEAFAGEGDPVGVITAPRGGSNIIRSISVGTGAQNPRAAGVLWMAGPASLLDDVSFVGGGFGGGPGRGRGAPGGPGAVAGTNAAPAATPAPRTGGPGRGRGPGGTHAGDLLVRDGGGGIIRGCWPHDTGAAVGLRVENTTTPGKIYQMSVEHHMRIETQFHNVRNWEICALQTEEENPAGALANAVEIQDSQDLLFANTYMYRVSRNVLPKEHAAIVRRSDRIAFQNVKVFSQTRLAFDNAVLEEASGVTVRPQFFTSFSVNRGTKAPSKPALPAVFAKGAKLERLATNFSNASGLTASGAGEVFFTDAANRNIYRWNAGAQKAELLAQIPGQPQVLGFAPPSSLLAIANERAVYHLNVNRAGPDASTTPVQAEAVTETEELAAETVLLLPVGLHNPLSVMKDMTEHRGYVYHRGSNTAINGTVTNEHRGYFYAPGAKTAIMAGGTWRPNLQSSQLAAFAPGQSHYLTSEDDGRTYVAKLDNYRSLSTTVFAERGGTAVVSDTAGNVYLASGQVWIYDRAGKEIGVLELPERPGSLAFGGPDKRTLFIGARSSLYSIRAQAPGI
ncbi:MAG: glycosyl hydrolase family 28-related protein [Verrucomicrobiota bacterium]